MPPVEAVFMPPPPRDSSRWVVSPPTWTASTMASAGVRQNCRPAVPSPMPSEGEQDDCPKIRASLSSQESPATGRQRKNWPEKSAPLDMRVGGGKGRTPNGCGGNPAHRDSRMPPMGSPQARASIVMATEAMASIANNTHSQGEELHRLRLHRIRQMVAHLCNAGSQHNAFGPVRSTPHPQWHYAKKNSFCRRHCKESLA